jgi:sugar/nucleoside kinase (ribokinase family)
MATHRIPMAETFDILVAGEINPDLILSGDGLEARFGQQETLVEQAALSIGSSSAIFACGAARLGLKVAMIGVIGNDLFGRFMLESLTLAGVNVSAVITDPHLQTGLSVILNRGNDRAILTHPGTMGALHAAQVTDAWLKRGRHLHVGSYFLQTALQPGLPDLLQRARRHGLSTSLDTNWDPAEQWHGVLDLLQVVDLFLPNQAEALAITRAPGWEPALERLASLVPQVAVKLGAGGAAAQAGGILCRAPALAIEIVDTVGAGDSFDAGFVYGYLQGWSLERTLRLAVACGSLASRGTGGTAAQPTFHEALQFVLAP